MSVTTFITAHKFNSEEPTNFGNPLQAIGPGNLGQMATYFGDFADAVPRTDCSFIFIALFKSYSNHKFAGNFIRIAFPILFNRSQIVLAGIFLDIGREFEIG